MEINLPFFKKKQPDAVVKEVNNDFLNPINDDGAVVINAGGQFVMGYNGESVYESQKGSIELHRNISKTAEVGSAISDIVNDAIISSDDIVAIELSSTKFSDSIKKKIQYEWEYVLGLLEFNKHGGKLFEDWYIDGVQYHQKLINTNKPKDGILKLKMIDPKSIKKIKEIVKERGEGGVEFIKEINEYFAVENEEQVGQQMMIKLPLESVAYAHSGLICAEGYPISHLSKAVKPYNQLNDLEDSTVIYNITRAPEKRVFYVDVGNLPKSKAEQYMTNIISKYKNKTVYDSNTGSIKDSVHLSSMMEDIWLPRKEGSKGTEVSSIGGTTGFDNIEEILYFRKKLYKSLNIPVSRLESESGFSLGRTGEITRDELKFNKYVSNLRIQFSQIFYDLLSTQLVLKGVLLQSEWEENLRYIDFKFKDNDYFTELAEAEIMQGRLDLLASIEGTIVQRYISNTTLRKKILQQTDDDIEMEDKLIAEEKKSRQFQDPADSEDGIDPNREERMNSNKNDDNGDEE